MIGFVRLKNFKSFKSDEVPLGRLTLLSGLNGSGKSTVLQAIGLIKQSLDSSMSESGHLILNGPLVELGTARDVLFHRFEKSVIEIALGLDVPDGDPISPEVRWSVEPDLESDVLRSAAPDNTKDVTALSVSGFQFLRADRITPATTFPKSHDAVAVKGFLGARGEYTPHFLYENGAEEVASDILLHQSEPTARSISAQANAWLQEFSPGARVEAFAVPMTDLVRLAFSFRSESAAYDEPLRPTNVGFGLTHALPVVVACVSARPGSLIIIENPEAQLHPRGQVAMGELIARAAQSGAQVILETHSDHVLNGIRLAVKRKLIAAGNTKLHFFARKGPVGSNFVTPTIDEHGRLSFWPEGFFDQWENSLDMLLS